MEFETTRNHWEEILRGHGSFKSMAMAAKHLKTKADEGTAALIDAHVFEEAKKFNGIMFGVDLTRNNKEMRVRLAEEYGLSLQQLQQLQEIIDKRGGVFCLKQDSASGTVELNNQLNSIS